VYTFYRVFCQTFFGLTGGLKVSGDNIPKKGPFIIVANHQSILDPMILMACIPHKITFLAASYIFQIPLVGQVVRTSGALPVNSNRGNIKSIKHCLSCLLDGGVVGLFPEGGVSLDGNLRPFKHGWAYLALKTGSPVLPVAIAGSRIVLPVGTYIPRRCKINVYAGELIAVERKAKIYRRNMEKLNLKMAAEIDSLLQKTVETELK